MKNVFTLFLFFLISAVNLSFAADTHEADNFSNEITLNELTESLDLSMDPCDPSSPDYDECICDPTFCDPCYNNPDPCDSSCPGYDECACDPTFCDPCYNNPDPCDSSCPGYDYCYCNPDPCDSSCPSYDPCYCNPDPCDSSCPDYDECVCDPSFCDPCYNNPDPCDPSCLGYDYCYCNPDPCDASCPDYDYCYCNPDPCDPSCPSYDPCYCTPDPCDPGCPEYDECLCYPELCCDDGIQNGEETGVDCGGPVCPVCECLAPSSHAATVLSSTSAVVSWAAVPNAVLYQLKYRVAGTSAWSAISTANTQRVLSNLQPNKYYQYKIRTKCDDGTWSGYTLISKFYSGTCAAPTGIVSIYLDQTRVKIRWDINTNSYKCKVRYREVGTSAWSWKVIASGNNFMYITGLTPNTDYEYRVTLRCNNEDWSPTSAKHYFSTNTPRLSAENVLMKDMKLYPNPAQDEVNVSFESATSNEVRVVVTDILGKVVQTQISMSQEGSNIETINVSQLTKGYYFLTVHNGNDVKTIKFIKS